MAASRPTAAHLAHVAALEEQRQPRQSKAVRALPSTSRLTMATAAHKANKEALLAQQGQIRDENDPFWEQRGDKASSYKGKTFDMSHVKGAPRAFTASAIMNQRQRVLCGKEKLEYERQIIEEGNRKRKQRDQARQRKEEEEGINQAPPDPVIVPAPAPSPALAPAPAPAPARRVSLIPTPNRGPAQRRLDRSTALDHNPSTNPSLLPLSAQHEQDEEEDEARSLPQAQGQAPEGGDGGEYLLPSQVVEDIEREIRGFYLSPTPRSAPAPFMLASPSPSSSPGPHEQREEQREDGSCWSPASPTRPRSLPLPQPQPQPQPEGAQEGDGEALGVFIAFSSSSSSSSSCSSSFVAAATPEHPSRTPPPEPPLRQPGLTPSAPGSGRTRTPTSVTHKRASPRSSNSSRTRAKRAADDDRYFVSANASLGKAVDSRP